MLLDSFMEGIFKSGSDLRSMFVFAEEVEFCLDQNESKLHSPHDLSLPAWEDVSSNLLLDFGCSKVAYRDFWGMQVIDGGGVIVWMAWQYQKGLQMILILISVKERLSLVTHKVLADISRSGILRKPGMFQGSCKKFSLFLC